MTLLFADEQNADWQRIHKTMPSLFSFKKRKLFRLTCCLLHLCKILLCFGFVADLLVCNI